MKSIYEKKIAPSLETIRQAAAEGAALHTVAARVGVSPATLKKYLQLGRQGQAQYAPLAQAFDACIPESEVEKSLYKACTGYTTQVVKHYKVKRVEYDEVTGKKIREHEELVEAKDQVYVPANISAQKFYLVNRLPERWGAKPTAEGDDGKAGVIVIPEIMEVTETSDV